MAELELVTEFKHLLQLKRYLSYCTNLCKSNGQKLHFLEHINLNGPLWLKSSSITAASDREEDQCHWYF